MTIHAPVKHGNFGMSECSTIAIDKTIYVEAIRTCVLVICHDMNVMHVNKVTHTAGGEVLTQITRGSILKKVLSQHPEGTFLSCMLQVSSSCQG